MKSLFCMTAALLLAAHSGAAQTISPQCPPGTTNSSGQPDNARIAQDACQKSIDVFQYMAPELALVLAGGASSLGQPAPIGTLGHFSVAVKATGLTGTVPEIDKIVPSTNGAQQSTYSTKDQLLGMPTADLDVGIFPGMKGGLSGLSFGAVDLLVSATYLRGINAGLISVTLPGSSFKFGGGARLGLLGESGVFPGISVSFLRRASPPIDLTASSGNDRLIVKNLSIQTNSAQLVVTKGFSILHLAGGIGRDSYTSSALISATVAPRTTPFATPGGSAGPISLKQDLSRTNLFADVVLALGPIKLAGEIGRVSGGEIATYNQFSGTQPAASRVYFSGSLRVGM